MRNRWDSFHSAHPTRLFFVLAFSANPPTLSSLPFLSTSWGKHTDANPLPLGGPVGLSRRRRGVSSFRRLQSRPGEAEGRRHHQQRVPVLAVRQARRRGRRQEIRHRRRGQDAAPRQRRGAGPDLRGSDRSRHQRHLHQLQRRHQHGRVLQDEGRTAGAVRDDGQRRSRSEDSPGVHRHR